MKKVMLSLFGAMLAAGMLAGCGNVDENKTPAQVKEEAATWDAAKIEKVMKEYRDVIDAKKAELSKVNDQLSEIPLKEKSGEKSGIRPNSCSLRSPNSKRCMRLWAR